MIGHRLTEIAVLCTLAAACLSCGGGEVREPHLRGAVTVDGIEFGLGGARGTVLNTPRTVYWAGVAMPALVRIDLYGMDVDVDEMGLPTNDAFPALTLMIPAGPDGDFYAGEDAIPASMEMQLGGVRTFIPESLLINCTVSLSESPLDTSIVDLGLYFAFDRGDSFYEGEYDCPICFPGVPVSESPPAYPSHQLPDTLFFTAAGDTLLPMFYAAMEEQYAGKDCFSVYAFTEPYTGSVPSKAGQTCLLFRIPADRADGEPVPTFVEACVISQEDTLGFSAGYAFCWATGRVEGSVLEGSVLFQGNGSEQATGFMGGGSYTAPIK